METLKSTMDENKNTFNQTIDTKMETMFKDF